MGKAEDKQRQEPKFWSGDELDVIAIKVVGRDETTLERLREQMQRQTNLELTVLDLAIHRVCVRFEKKDHRRGLKLSRESLARYDKLQEGTSQT